MGIWFSAYIFTNKGKIDSKAKPGGVWSCYWWQGITKKTKE